MAGMTSSSAIRVDRLVTRPGEADSPRIERIGIIWHVRTVDLARQVLRERDGSHQAGFLVEVGSKATQPMRPPNLWMDGAEHREQRAETARFFAPKTVDKRYRELMETRSQQLVDDAVAAGEVTIDDLSLRYSVEVAAQVIGLTNSSVDGMAKRLGAPGTHWPSRRPTSCCASSSPSTSNGGRTVDRLGRGHRRLLAARPPVAGGEVVPPAGLDAGGRLPAAGG